MGPHPSFVHFSENTRRLRDVEECECSSAPRKSSSYNGLVGRCFESRKFLLFRKSFVSDLRLKPGDMRECYSRTCPRFLRALSEIRFHHRDQAPKALKVPSCFDQKSSACPGRSSPHLVIARRFEGLGRLNQ